MHGVAADAGAPGAAAALVGVGQPVKATAAPKAEKAASKELFLLFI